MRYKALFLMLVVAEAGFAVDTRAAIVPVLLGTAGDFAVLAGERVTNTGTTVINGGGVGVWSGTEMTGFSSVTVEAPYTLHSADAVAHQAQLDLITAYNTAAGLTPFTDLTGQNLGGQTLTPGVYRFSSSAQLTGTLTLNNLGDPNAQFVFQIVSTLTTAPDSIVQTINGGAEGGCSVFWQVGSSATLDTGTLFEGHILALSSITMNTGAKILEGSALARNGEVTLQSNEITNCTTSAAAGVAAPLPAAWAMSLGLLPVAWLMRRRMAVVFGQ